MGSGVGGEGVSHNSCHKNSSEKTQRPVPSIPPICSYYTGCSLSPYPEGERREVTSDPAHALALVPHSVRAGEPLGFKITFPQVRKFQGNHRAV